MARDTFDVLKDALSLPMEARAALIDTLIGSLDPIVDADAEESWREEICQRVQQVDNQAVQLIPWENARRQLRAGSSR